MQKNFIHLLIDRWLSGASTEEEKEQLHRYFLQYGLPEEQLTDDPRYHPAKKQSERMFRQLTTEFGLNAPVKKMHAPNRKWILRIAAAVIPLILITAGIYFRWLDPKNGSTSSLKQIINNGKGLSQVTLADGSTILLNKNASLLLDTLTFAQHRHVTLNGEAYFEVAHDPRKPFTVTSDGLTTKVLGTTFNIKMDTAGSHRTTVTLFTGQVSLGAGGVETQVLHPEQAAVYDHRSGQLQPTVASPYALTWKTKEIVCKNEPFENIIDYLEGYYGIRIISSKTITGRQFSGTLTLQGDLSSVLDRLLFVHQLHHRKKDGNTIIIF